MDSTAAAAAAAAAEPRQVFFAACWKVAAVIWHTTVKSAWPQWSPKLNHHLPCIKKVPDFQVDAHSHNQREYWCLKSYLSHFHERWLKFVWQMTHRRLCDLIWTTIRNASQRLVKRVWKEGKFPKILCQVHCIYFTYPFGLWVRREMFGKRRYIPSGPIRPNQTLTLTLTLTQLASAPVFLLVKGDVLLGEPWWAAVFD